MERVATCKEGCDVQGSRRRPEAKLLVCPMCFAEGSTRERRTSGGERSRADESSYPLVKQAFDIDLAMKLFASRGGGGRSRRGPQW